MPIIKEYPELPKAPWDISPIDDINKPWVNPIIPIKDKGIECPLCKMVWKGVMGYCCPNIKCPIQIKATC